MLLDSSKKSISCQLEKYLTFNAFKNFAVPLCAIVPRQSINSWRVIPMPESLQERAMIWTAESEERLIANNLWTYCSLRDSHNSIILISLNTDVKISSILQKLRLSDTKKSQLVQGITSIAVDINICTKKSDAKGQQSKSNWNH